MGKWFVYKRGTIPLQRISSPMSAVSELGHKYNVPHFEHILYAVERSKLYWCWNDNEIKDNAKKILEIVKTEDGKREHLELLGRVAEKAIKAADKVRNIDLSKLSNEDLINAYEELKKKCFPAHAFMNSDIDAVDIIPVEIFREKIIEELPRLNEKEKLAIIRDLTTPAFRTYVTQEEEAILEYIRKHNGKIDEKAIQKIVEKFWWTALGWETIKLKTKESFIKKISEFRKIDIEKRLKKIKNALQEIIDKRNGHIKKYKLSNEIRFFIRLFDDYTYYHDLRKEMQMKVMYSFYLLGSEAGKRLGIKEKDWEWLLDDEICKALKTGIVDKEEINRRKKAITVIVSRNNLDIYSGKEAIEKRKQEIEEDIGKVDSFKGVIASPGDVRGTAKVCNGADEAIKKIKKGDILVVPMTMPDYVPAMKKAAAIVTNEGGITCHAAIISRELRIPCIVGTEIATEVLKDGDLIEVDANHGVVRKIG